MNRWHIAGLLDVAVQYQTSLYHIYLGSDFIYLITYIWLHFLFCKNGNCVQDFVKFARGPRSHSSPCGGIGGLWAPSFMSIMMKVLTIVRTQMSLCRGLRGAQRAPLSPLHNDGCTIFCFTYFICIPEFQQNGKYMWKSL